MIYQTDPLNIINVLSRSELKFFIDTFFWDTRYLKLISQYELHTLPNTKANAAKDHGEHTESQTAPGPPNFA